MTLGRLTSLQRTVKRLLMAAIAGAPSWAFANVLDPAGPVGRDERTVLLNALAIMLCIVIPTIALTIGFAWWYRASNRKAKYLPDWAYSGQVELVVWAIPALVVLFLSGVTWIGSHELDPYKPLESAQPPIEVQVVSLDWKWLFIYPEQNLATVNELVVPAGVPIRFRLTSATVMNAFFVPRLGSMMYTMNGMETKLHLQADKPGSFDGMSAHYSGDGFSDMHFEVKALAPSEFQAWASQTRASGSALDTAGYAKLTEQSENVKPMSFKAVEPGLFDAIVQRTAPDAPGSKVEHQKKADASLPSKG